MSGNGGVELDVQETLRAILHTLSRIETQLELHAMGLKECLVALGVKERLEVIAKDLDEATPVDISMLREATTRR